ncbi:hypothetical protein IW262DRAFT_1302243 [Armillaria fumosa]|nr:hypothetical protein IW262DRAFT_1302243 [Armillaria fumosa]
MAWRSRVPVVQSHALPVHPFDLEQRLLAILDGMPYIPADTADDGPTLDAHEYEQWLQMTFSKEQRCHDKEASKERNTRVTNQKIADFLSRKRDDQAQHHRARHNEPPPNVYNHMLLVGPSGLMMTMPGQPYPPPQFHHWYQAYEAASPTS